MEGKGPAAQAISVNDLNALSKHHRGAAGQLQRVLNFLGHNPVQKTDNPVRIGVLGASQVRLRVRTNREPVVEITKASATKHCISDAMYKCATAADVLHTTLHSNSSVISACVLPVLHR
jgi:hypothetical protein